MMKITKDGKRDSNRMAWLSAAVVSAVIGGCSPPPVDTAEAKLRVGMPTGSSSDPGKLTDASIDPPPLTEIGSKTSSASEDQTLVQTASGKPELVPTPKPRPDRGSGASGRPEVVPTPEGTPVAAKRQQGESGEAPEIGGPVDYKTWPKPDLVLVVSG